MMTDIRTVLWKEWKELLAQGGNSRAGKLGPLFLVIPAILLPLQMGRPWVETPIALVSLWFVPMLVAPVIADSIAGERERHTLETLLAGRLPDRAILYGKLLAAVGFAFGETLLFLLPGMLAVNVAHWRGEIAVYPPSVWLGYLLLGPLLATLVAAIGLVVSLRAATVRQAQQTLLFALMAPIFIPIVLPLLPERWLERAVDLLRDANVTLIVLLAAVLLAVVDVLAVSAIAARFTRPRLILE